MSVLHKYFPGVVSAKYAQDAVHYILGRHMDNNTSWVSGVGTKSAKLGYGQNRADRFYIAGGVVNGYANVLPDFPEAVDDYGLLRDETGYSIENAAKWIPLGYAAHLADQAITFGPLTDKTVGDPPFKVSATTDSGLPVSFSASGSCTVSGDIVTLVSAGPCTITASQPGDADHYPAADVSRSFQVVTSQQGSVGGTVPATLSLTLGTPASFGVFTPGVTRSYDATTAATVTSTAGDALLSVADPSGTHTGHLVNGGFFLPQPLQAHATNASNQGTAFNDVGSATSPLNLLMWNAPVSNDAVTLQFRQLVDDDDALRTGSYSKTLTFTLSTTTP